MKLNDTYFCLTPQTHCCRIAFTNHFEPPAAEETEVMETAPEVAYPNPDVNVGDNLTCPTCKNVILLDAEGDWRSLPATAVVDVSSEAPVVPVEDLPIIPGTLTPA
jgi:hypothetical protein